MKIQINNIHSVNSLSLIKLLKDVKKYSVEIIGSDILEYGEYAGSLLVDKYYKAPPITEEQKYLEFLNELYEKEKIDLLIPASDAEILFLSKYKSTIKVLFYLADFETIRLFKDKLMATEKLQKQGIEVPPVIFDLRNERKVIFRKRESVNSQGIYIVDLHKDKYIENYFNENYFIQPYIEGETYVVDILSDKDGIPRLIIPRKTLEIKDGTAYRSQIVYDRKLIDLSKQICTLYKLPGFCNIEFIKRNGVYFFIETNVRFAGSGIFSAIASFNFMEMYISHFLLNEPLKCLEYYIDRVAWNSIITRYFEELKYIPEH